VLAGACLVVVAGVSGAVAHGSGNSGSGPPVPPDAALLAQKSQEMAQYAKIANDALKANPDPPGRDATLPPNPVIDPPSCPTAPVNTPIGPPTDVALLDGSPRPTTDIGMTVNGRVYAVAGAESYKRPGRGAIRVVTYPADLCRDPTAQMTENEYIDPSADGALMLTARQGPVLTFERPDGTDGTFDVATMSFGS